MNTKIIISFFLGLILTGLDAQTRWTDHFSYSQVSQMLQIDNRIYAVSENALFSYQLDSKELNKLSKANNLNAVKPSAIAYAPDFEYLIVGYQSGEMDILGQENQYNFLEIPLDEYQGDKTINHLAVNGDVMTISASYGVSVFDLERREFSETTFFRNGSDYFSVYESVLFNDVVYSASEYGIYYHANDDIIPYFAGWEQPQNLPTQRFEHIVVFGEKVMASSGGNLYKMENDVWNLVGNYGSILDLTVNNDQLAVTTSASVYVLDNSLNLTQTSATLYPALCGISTSAGVYYGTEENGLLANNSTENIYPDGPVSNNSYDVTAEYGKIWLSPGGQQSFNSPTNNTEGYSNFNGTEWIHVGSERLNNARDIINIAVNPSDSTQIFVSSWQDATGLFEMSSNQLVTEYNPQNSALVDLMRIGGSCFDDEGNLWVTQTFAQIQGGNYNALIKRSPENQWTYYSLEGYDHSSAAGVRAPIIDDDGYLWISGTRGDGLTITNTEEYFEILQGEGSGDLPDNKVMSVAVESGGTAWIGTWGGLRIKRNAINELQNGDPETESVVIVQDGIAEALLTDTKILDVTIDPSNRKWIGTDGAGVFYISASGQETIYNFTEEDSPLPSNTIYSIDVDEQTGEVYFATANGLVSYKGDVVDTGDSFGEVLAYPNPVRPDYQGLITVKGLANSAEVKITDVVGNLMYQATAAGGIIQWDGTNLKGKKVASGIYLVLMLNADGTESKTTKIAIIR